MFHCFSALLLYTILSNFSPVMPLFTSDLADETSTEFETESYSGEETTSAVATQQRGSVVPGYIIPYKMSLVAIAVLGILTNGVVLGCFCISGRSKMNASSLYVANHTTLGRPTRPYFRDAIS